MVVEIPAGTSKKVEYNPETNEFEIDQRNGTDRIISFLPYPGNYGFIPSTLSDPATGGDGDPLDVILIAEHLPQGEVIAIQPIAMLKLIDDGEEDFKILAVPYENNKKIINVSSLAELRETNSAILDIITLWFQNYDTEPAETNGWGDTAETLDYIRKNIQAH